ncbi:MAG: RbsD/FucU family protein [Actinomycetia bacterium]|nr:RbsD/FucU family protein [Actinomycetes bacterium]
MLLGPLTHPELLAALGRAGHGSQVLITDGNYPHSTGAHPEAKRIWLNLAPGLLTVSQVLGVLVEAIPLERAAVMVPEADALPEHRMDVIPAHEDYRGMLPEVSFDELPRFAFYGAAQSDSVAVVIATGDQRFYANLLLSIGTRPA